MRRIPILSIPTRQQYTTGHRIPQQWKTPSTASVRSADSSPKRLFTPREYRRLQMRTRFDSEHFARTVDASSRAAGACRGGGSANSRSIIIDDLKLFSSKIANYLGNRSAGELTLGHVAPLRRIRPAAGAACASMRRAAKRTRRCTWPRLSPYASTNAHLAGCEPPPAAARATPKRLCAALARTPSRAPSG